MAAGQNDQVDGWLQAARETYARGEHDAALAAYDRILDRAPDEPRALCLRGLIYRDRGDILAAERDFRRAVKVAPNMPLTYQLLGDLLHNAKHLVMAADIYEQGLACDPDNLPILGNLAHTRLGLGHYAACLELSQRVVGQDARQQESWFRIGASLCQLQRYGEAVAPLRKAVAQKSDCLRSRAALCVALQQSGKGAAAVKEMTAAAPYIETNFDYLTQFNEVLAWLNSTETALQVLRAYLDRHPDNAGAWTLLAKLYIVSGRELEGNALLEKAAALAPQDADIQLTLGLQQVKFGDYHAGLVRYRKRWEKPQLDPREGWWDIAAPAWDGAALPAGALQIWTEQGIGDLAMFAGCFDLLPDLAPRVMLETISRFRGLMQRSFPWAEIYQRDQLPVDFVQALDVRAHAPIGDLPLLLGLDLENLPSRDGYLIPDATTTWRLRERYLARFPGRLIVGISWRSGNKTSATTRSAELDLWRDILADTRYGFVSLQYGSVGGEIAVANAAFGSDIFHDPEIDPLIDLDQFAAQVAAVDLVISVDNSTVHFAGALGKRVWVLLPRIADWRWLDGRDDSIWYARARLFRQPSPSAWPAVMARVAAALAQHEATVARADLVAMMRRCADQLAYLGQSADAEVFLRRILQMDAEDAAALNGLGRIGLATGHVAEALPFLARAAFLAPQRTDYHYDLARAAPVAIARSGGLPDWSPDAEHQRRLYLWSEGILAQDIAASAALSGLRAELDALAVACHPALMPLLARQDLRLSVFSLDDVGAEDLAGLELSAQAPLAALQLADTVNAGPWLRADPARVAEQRAINRAQFGSRIVLGVVAQQEGSWAGVPGANWASLPPDLCAALSAVPDVGIVLLGNAAPWPAEVGPGIRLDPRLDLGGRADNYAAALAAVDLVIAVESAAAWLAAALGQPLFLCQGRTGWGMAPALPATAVFRQSSNGSWVRATAELLDAVGAFRRGSGQM